MKALLQRVNKGSVESEGKMTGVIGKGLVVLLGVENGDSEKDLEYLVDKTVNLRIFDDGDGKMNLSLLDVGGEMLVVSQFTLLADTRKGRRPSYINAAPPAVADSFYEEFIKKVRGLGVKVETGVFQTMMVVHIENDGPVTIMVDSKDKLK
ncbi:MAG: D-tyrosyl-tRNA(Tyr) deacylase [Dehalococcoidales bacterium]|jgi:D-tyrosyl-tRNA(Tyr) deacylase|nr:D-tyrosyl-tRNA(Tyr) deacylase [Dehalococcoidales bacterium]